MNAGEDPHLRSAEDIIGYTVWDAGSPIGLLEDFGVDDASWRITSLRVEVGDWRYRRSISVSTRLVASVSWAHRRVNLHPSRNKGQLPSPKQESPGHCLERSSRLGSGTEYLRGGERVQGGTLLADLGREHARQRVAQGPSR